MHTHPLTHPSGTDDLGSELQSWREKLGSSSVRHRSWFPGSDEKDIGFGIDAVGDDEREDEDAEAHYQGDKLQEGWAGEEKGVLRTPGSCGNCSGRGGRALECWSWL